MNDIPLIKENNFRMTNKDFALDNEKHAVRFCLWNESVREKVWLPGYCLFYISNGGLGFYLYIGRGVDPSAISLGIDNNEDPYKLKIIGVDEV